MSGKWVQPDRTSQDAQTYLVNIENCFGVLERWALWFSVEPENPASMNVYVNAGYIFQDGTRTMTWVSGTTKTVSSNSSGNPRLDIVQMNDAGTISIKEGTPAASPTYPTLDIGYYPLAGIYVADGATEIDSDNIEDLRNLGGLGVQEAGSGKETFDTVGPQTFTAKKTGPHFVVLVAGGGGGGGGAMSNYWGGGGGGGQHICGVVNLTKGQEVTINIGYGGYGGYGGSPAPGGSGGNGGSSSFGGYLSAVGGYGGVGAVTSHGTGGYGGVGGSVGQNKLAENNGYNGLSGNPATGGASGCVFGTGGYGAGGNGGPGNNYGGGGGGGGGAPSNGWPGGAGAKGYCMVIY